MKNVVIPSARAFTTGLFAFLIISLFLGTGHRLSAATNVEIQEWLLAHNTYRALHAVPDLIWSTELARKAQAWADTCPSAHSTYGENMLFANFYKTPGDVVARWYNEEPLYDYNTPGYSISTGHFTQVVWKNSSEIGCGYTTGCSGQWPYIWVCQYNPPGNVYGQFAANVFPPSPEINASQGFLPSMLLFLLLK